jgi:alpha,alpha-trehalose phosphorylase
MAAVGIGQPSALAQAETVLPGLSAFRIEDFVSSEEPSFAAAGEAASDITT